MLQEPSNTTPAVNPSEDPSNPQTVQSATHFHNPIHSDGADPWIIKSDDCFFYTHTNTKTIDIWRVTSFPDVESSSMVRVWSPQPTGPCSKNVWAPELHKIQGKWYIYFAADDGDNANHRMFVLEAITDDPQGPYRELGMITDPANDKWAIDGTILEMDDGSMYFIWSGWPGDKDKEAQNLYIAPMSNPWTLSGPRVLISTPTHSWEGWINEGPQVLKRDGKVFVVYACNASWTNDYQLGMLSLEGKDVLDPASWVKHPQSVFKSSGQGADAVHGPGHCSFVTSVDGKTDWIVYHAAKRSNSGWDRNVRAQKFAWTDDGLPHFGQPLPLGTPISRTGTAFPPAAPTTSVTNVPVISAGGVLTSIPVEQEVQETKAEESTGESEQPPAIS